MKLHMTPTKRSPRRMFFSLDLFLMWECDMLGVLSVNIIPMHSHQVFLPQIIVEVSMHNHCDRMWMRFQTKTCSGCWP